jgi:hypothetical protein
MAYGDAGRTPHIPILGNRIWFSWQASRSALDINFGLYKRWAGPSGRRGLRRRSAAACLLRFWVLIPSGAWMSFMCVVTYRSLPRVDHSTRGVLPTVMRCCV